ncbi:MAG: AAA family ATPase [Bacteroidales bacterium]|jgi:ATP-dependent exoDNAse (exonuclease V) alpha subunit|nr:AAA family ATPase [Bacteroidales bacterium]
MAIYHLHVGFVSRSSGRSSVQAAAYICGEKLQEDRRAKIADYSHKASEVIAKETLAPEHSKYRDLQVWNSAENFEDAYVKGRYKTEETKMTYLSNAQTAMSLTMALPHELSLEKNRALVREFVNTRFTSRNLITTYAIHNADGNLHAHLLVSRRAIGENGEFLNKKDQAICTKSSLLETRKLWGDIVNAHLENAGIDDRVTEKSFKDLGIKLEATKHRGWYSDQLGNNSKIIRENLEIAKNNEERLLQNPNIILDCLNATKAVFTEKDMVKEISKRVVDKKRISVIFDRALEEAKFVGENHRGEKLYTGEKYEQLESDVFSRFEEISSKSPNISCEEKIISEVLEKYSYLNQEQKTAVTGICDEQNFSILIGRAGAGKTTTVRAISEIYGKNGARVVGMSLSAVAAENLENDAKIESRTIAFWTHEWRSYEAAKEEFLSFDSVVTDGILKQLDWYQDLKRYEKSQLKSGDVIVIDESSMVGASDWKEILDAANKFGAKIIAVGDNNQFKAIASGDCFSRMLQEQKQGVFELCEIRRQEVDWMKEASNEFAKLNIFAGLVKYENNEKLHAIEDQKIANVVANKYLEFEKQGSVSVLCYRKDDCRKINEQIRLLKKEKGELSEDIAKINERNFSIGERVMFLENNKKYDIKNGQFAVIVGAAKNDMKYFLHVQLENGKNTIIDTSEYDKIDHSYAMTLHKSQGKTIDNVIVVVDKMMDASATYVAMTRHKKDVAMFYKTSDFRNFKSLADNLSKYRHKDSILDYRLQDNSNKTRVYEYKNNLMEMAETLREIHAGKQDWAKYQELKNANTELGREIAQNYDSHKLYLNQIGITKEKLEISVGLRQRPLTNVEITAKNTVELYAKSSQESRELLQKMQNQNFNITRDPRYAEYTQIREIRNDLAKEILANYPLHREFVNQVSREYFISKKGMENQVTYAEQMKEKAKTAEMNFFRKLENMKTNRIENYGGNSVAYYVDLNKKREDYELRKEVYLNNFEYAPHVSKSMVYAYCGKHNITFDLNKGDLTYEYASIIAHRKMNASDLKEPSIEIVHDSIREALCFQALKKAENITDLSKEKIHELAAKAEILSEHLVAKNVHVLNNKKTMHEAFSVISVVKNRGDSEINPHAPRIAFLNQEDFLKEKQFQMQKIQEMREAQKLEQTRSRSFGIEM